MQAGFHVVGVDRKPQPNYCGDEFICADVLDLTPNFLRGFSLTWSSPPCLAHTVMRHAPGTKKHFDLIAPTRDLLVRSGKPYCIENVPGAPMLNPIVLCGSMFGLQAPDGAQLRRHRLFETSFPLLTPPCQHGRGTVIGVYRPRPRPASRSWVQPPRQIEQTMGARIYRHGRADRLDDARRTFTSHPPAYSRFVAAAFLAQQIIEPVLGTVE